MSEQQQQARTPAQKRDRIGLILYGIYLLLLVAAVVIFLRIIGIQLFFRPAPKIQDALRPASVVRVLEPVRGDIRDCKGRLLAMSYPMYELHMDCTVQKAHFGNKGKEKGEALEREWLQKASALSEGLAEFFPEKTAQGWYELIRRGRAENRRFLPIGHLVDHKTLLRIQQLPLYREGKNKGGLIVDQRNIRRYPYGALARRTIGFVRDNRATGVGNTHIGLEGRFDYLLHGKDGRECLRRTDYGLVRDFDSSYVRAVDGKDLVTTLDIDLQDAADRALRSLISEEDDLEGACLVLMEVKTGAIRAMVNLSRDPLRSGSFEEITNLAVGRKGEPGSVFKTVTLLTVLSDKAISSLDETIPTRHGIVHGTSVSDQHIRDYEREHKKTEISILDGFKMSSNYVFATLALENYGGSKEKTKQFIEKIYSYKLGETFDFDIAGLASPTIPTPETRYWTKSDLATMGYGYSTEETPLHILTFYNAIAGKGRMMKPYLVERADKTGTGPSVLNAAICTPAVADTVTRALKAVTEEGTARVLKNAACAVAGKTGTSFGTFENGQYRDAQGRKKYQGTFVGFFPAEDPQYSIICTVFSKPTSRSYQGGGIPARAVKAVVAHVCNTDPYWTGSLSRSEALPQMGAPELELPVPDANGAVQVPNLSGLSLKDALHITGLLGLDCRYSGAGHVRSQEPRAGKTAAKGSTISIELK